MNTAKSIVAATCLLLSLPGFLQRPLHSQEQSQELESIVNVLPEKMNTLTIVDYTALDDSQWAKQNGVKIGDLVDVPPMAQQVVFASELDFNFVYPKRQFAFATYNQAYDFAANASSSGYEVEKVAGHDLAFFNDTTAVTPIDRRTVALFSVEGTPDAERWIESHLDQPDDKRVSVFLRYAAIEAVKENNLFVVAMDLRGAISEETIRKNVQRSSLFQEINRESITKLLIGTEGLVFMVRATDTLNGKLQVRFAEDADILDGKEIMLVDSVLRSIGARINGIDQWESSVDKNVLTLSGPLQLESVEDLINLAVFDSQMPSNLRRLTRKLAVAKRAESGSRAGSPDDAKESTRSTANSEKQTPEVNPKIQATQAYMKRVQRLLQSLHRKSQEDSLAESRFWLDRYAFKIQYLDREDVDEDLLIFADEATAQLRGMAEMLENGLLKAAEEHESGWVATPTWRTVNYGGVRIRRRAYFYAGNGWGNEPLGADRLQASNEINDAAVEVKTDGIEIVREFNDIGERLANRYGFEFERWTPGEIK